MTQRDQVLQHLIRAGSISPLQAIQMYGITRLAARINELRKEGFPIQTSMERTGRVRCAVYRLAS